jgi:hypothetical protein
MLGGVKFISQFTVTLRYTRKRHFLLTSRLRFHLTSFNFRIFAHIRYIHKTFAHIQYIHRYSGCTYFQKILYSAFIDLNVQTFVISILTCFSTIQITEFNRKNNAFLGGPTLKIGMVAKMLRICINNFAIFRVFAKKEFGIFVSILIGDHCQRPPFILRPLIDCSLLRLAGSCQGEKVLLQSLSGTSLPNFFLLFYNTAHI